MVNFIRLMQNEIIKIYRLKSTWVMYAILLILIIGFGFLAKTFGEMKTYEEDTWRETLEAENEALLEEMEEFEYIEEFNLYLMETNNYYLENDIRPPGYGAWQFVMENELMLSFVSLFTIIVVAGIISNEYR